jgi:hypothetical protein
MNLEFLYPSYISYPNPGYSLISNEITSPEPVRQILFNYPNGSNNLYDENVMHFTFADTVLMITPPGIGFVEEKYDRVQSP